MSRYVESLALADRVYRLFMESVKFELKRLSANDINNVQAIILYNIGEERMTIGELVQRKYYLGSNITYNLHKMVDSGYINIAQAEYDKRASYVSLTEKGAELYKKLDLVFQKHLDAIKKDEIEDFSGILKQMELSIAKNIYH